jgi:hypothetical protein
MRVSGLKLVPQIDTWPWAVTFARKVTGRLVCVALFTVLLAATKISACWWLAGLFLALISIVPNQRWNLLFVAAIGWIVVFSPVNEGVLRELAAQHEAEEWVSFWPVMLSLFLLMALGGVWLVRRYPSSLLAHRPVSVLLILLLGLLTASSMPLTGLPWCIVAISAMALGKYIWFIAYSLHGEQSRQSAPAGMQLAVWRPFWGFTTMPYGKGTLYLGRVEAKDEQEFAVVQLKALKLMVWVLILLMVQTLFVRTFYFAEGNPLNGYVNSEPAPLVPTYPDALDRHLQGNPYPLPVRWLAIICHFLYILMSVTVAGHSIVATCRMAGFNILRNTYRPLTADSIVEFYNRYYYYFKELLTEFFFFPTYLRYFKGYPRFRLFAATMAAAGLGNFLFHFLSDEEVIMRRGIWDALVARQVFALYVVVLAIAITLSQMRLMDRKRRRPVGYWKALSIVGVLMFYILISILSDNSHSRTIGDCASFFLSLFWP